MADFARQGTANHTFLQFCDFALVETLGIEKEKERLLRTRMMDGEMLSLLDVQGLHRFFASDLYRRMRDGKELRREMRFSVQMEANELQENHRPEVRH